MRSTVRPKPREWREHLELHDELGYLKNVLACKYSCLSSGGYELVCKALEINTIDMDYFSEDLESLTDILSTKLSKLSCARPLVLNLVVTGIPVGTTLEAHAFTLFVGEHSCFFVDNNGEKYKDTYPYYRKIKTLLTEALGEYTKMEVFCNRKPTYNKKGICSFASIETAALFQDLIEDDVKQLLELNEKILENNEPVFPTRDLIELPNVRDKLTKYTLELEKSHKASISL